MRVVPDAASTAQVRHRLAADLLVQGLRASVVDEAALLVSELVANAVRYGQPLTGGELRVCWENGADDVLIEVSDGAAVGPVRPRRASPQATSGRGLAIVAQLADDWGVQRDDGGTTVWVRMRAASSAYAPPVSASG